MATSEDELLMEMLLRWEESRKRGRETSAEELCVQSPELLGTLRRQIKLLRAMDAPIESSSLEVGSPTTSLSPTPETRLHTLAKTPSHRLLADRRIIPNYEILEEIGRGGMGIVYRAVDQRRGDIVALKTMQRVDPVALARFKREFRALSDVAHPNLVDYHELVSDGESWFFVMELVEGTDFLTHIRGESGGQTVGMPLSQIRRLRDALHQLVEGVDALHQAGRLHRDLKPSNVLVTYQGRVVILDFGLAAELGPSGVHHASASNVLGTVGYMAPEQAASLPVSPASDWYSVGVMLFEVLTGRLPFLGRPLEVLMDKQRFEPPAPREVAPGIPEDLDALCVDLLRRDSEARPTGRDVLRRLGGTVAKHEIPLSSSPPTKPLVGRATHFEMLEAAFSDMVEGHSIIVYVRGSSGAGKTTLVQRFLDHLAQRGEALILAGRCYERESVPYKALDGVIDALGRHLKELPSSELQSLLPRDVRPLVQVFPVLRHLAAGATSLRVGAEVPDPQVLRRRASAALRELLGRLGDRKPLVLFIDDLQWGDLDSAALLDELLQPPDAPIFLLLGTYRSEDAGTSPFLNYLQRFESGAGVALQSRKIAVEPLTHTEAEVLAASLLGDATETTQAYSKDIARESRGNPFFIYELVRHFHAGIAPSEGVARGGIALDEVLWGRIRRLPDKAGDLLEVIAVSGGPLGEEDACRAARLSGENRNALALLRSGRLIRGTAGAEHRLVETYHDRVRETIMRQLAPATVASHHLRLAYVLEESGKADPEVLAYHFQGANELHRAGEYFAKAADQAAELLAFDHAVTLYRQALNSPLGQSDEVSVLCIKLGNALSNARRGTEAAQAYLAAVPHVGSADALDLRRRAAQEYLISGRIDEGLTVLHAVLDDVGMKLPATPRGVIVFLLSAQTRIRLRGLRFRPRQPSEIPAADLMRIDICWAASCGLSLTDTIRGAAFHTHGLLSALRAGERDRIVRALSLEAGYVSSAGSRSARRTRKLLEFAEAIAPKVPDPYVSGILALGQGMSAYLEGRWERGIEQCDRALEVFRDRCMGVAWELNTARIFALWGLGFAGQVAELGRRRAAFVKEALERGDLHAMTTLRSYALSRLAEDDPLTAREELRQAMSGWPFPGFHVQHYHCLLSTVHIGLYCGEPATAWDYYQDHRSAYAQSLLSRFQSARVDMAFSESRIQLALAAVSRSPKAFARDAERNARRLEREGVAWAKALALLTRAGVASLRGEVSHAATLYDDAATALDALAMSLYAAAARYRLGQLLGDERGRSVVSEAETQMSRLGVRNPLRMAAVYAPAGR